MKLGIKVGPQEQSIHDLEHTRAPYCEVWFNVNETDKYGNLFDYVIKQRLDVGLHFWGALADGTSPNIAYPDAGLIAASLALMQKTIDIAAQNHFQYVNIHPGTAIKAKVDFGKNEFVPMTDPVDQAVSEQLFLEHAKGLHEYGGRRGVVLTVETVPVRVARGWHNPDARKNPINIFELPVSTLIKASQQGIWIANDLGHTAGNVITNDRAEVFKFLSDTTQALFAQTRLIHVGFIVPPYAGADFHDMLDNPLLDTDQAIPNRNELAQLLKLFQNREDVWAIVEPLKDHPKNYQILKEIVEAQ